MTRQTKLEEIRRVCLEATPKMNNLPLGLANVLIAVEQDVATGNLGERFKEICCTWDLYENDLTLQSDETIDFLHSILCPKGK